MSETLKQIFRSWYFDPMVATVTFTIATCLYWLKEREEGLSRYKRTLYHISYLSILSFVSYWTGLFILRTIVPPPNGGDIPDGFPSDIFGLLYLLLEVGTGIVEYDFIFFFIHFGMHSSTVFYTIHKKHHHHTKQHETVTVEAKDVLHHGLVDGSLQVLVNILVQRFTIWGNVKSRLARGLHNIIVIWMLTESHTATNSYRIFRNSWFVGVRDHRLHHLHGAHRYQQFFGYLDDARLRYSSKKK